MGGPGDIGGEVSGEEAAWRDLIAHYDLQEDLSSEAVPWPERESLPGPGATDGSPAGSAGASLPGSAAGSQGDAGGASPANSAVPADRARIVWEAGDPRNYSPPDEPEEGKYVPVPLPPPARLDPLAKFAWAGLIGGPAYLLIGVLVGWTISGFAAFAAIGVFIAGFVVLVIRLGDGSKRDDDDDGAVV
jgi:hypothetical protein